MKKENRFKLILMLKIMKPQLEHLEWGYFENVTESLKLAELRMRIGQLELKAYPWKKITKN